MSVTTIANRYARALADVIIERRETNGRGARAETKAREIGEAREMWTKKLTFGSSGNRVESSVLSGNALSTSRLVYPPLQTGEMH